jgi:hypothetical protein
MDDDHPSLFMFISICKQFVTDKPKSITLGYNQENANESNGELVDVLQYWRKHWSVSDH